MRTTTGTIATTSDARLKKNVTEYTGALAQISALRPVHYEYREPGKSFQMPGRHLGFIAQEVEQVFPRPNLRACPSDEVPPGSQCCRS